MEYKIYNLEALLNAMVKRTHNTHIHGIRYRDDQRDCETRKSKVIIGVFLSVVCQDLSRRDLFQIVQLLPA